MVNILNSRNRGFTNQKPVKRHVVLGVPTEGTVLEEETDLNEGDENTGSDENTNTITETETEGNDQSPAGEPESAPVTEAPVTEEVTPVLAPVTQAPNFQSDEELLAQGFTAEEIAELRASESNS